MMKPNFAAIKNKAVNGVTDIKTYWDNPKPGNYVSNKEFMYFILGAGGCGAAGASERQLYFSAGCFFVGAIFGLAMKDFVMLGIVGTILGYAFNPINMLVTDNLGRLPKKTMRWINCLNVVFAIVGVGCFFMPHTMFESIMPAFPQVVGTKLLIQVFYCYYRIVIFRRLAPKYGKYKPWIFVNYAPFVLTSFLLVYFPYGDYVYYQRFWIMHLMFSIWSLFSYYNDQVGCMENVITPNTVERTKIMSFGSLLYNLFPSIVEIALPVLVAATGGYTALRSFKTSVLFAMLFFSPLSLILAFKVKERVFIDLDRRPDISFKKGVKEAMRNKYIWIRTVSGVLGSFRNGAIDIITIMVVYMLRRDWVIAVLSAVIGTSNIPGYLTANFFFKKFGKKKILLASYYSSVIAAFLEIGAIYMNSFILMIVIHYISRTLIQLGDLAQRGMTADIWDYQQYLSGERLESFHGITGMITTPITMFTALLVPLVYASYGFTSDWTILYDPVIRNKIFMFTILISTIGGIISVIPYHFYDLTEDKHREIIKELERREEALHPAPQTQEAVTEEAMVE